MRTAIPLLAFATVLTVACGAARAAAPKVVKASPDDGQADVDPATSEIRIVFDQPMSRTGWSFVGGGEKYPRITARPRWVDAKTVVLPVKLQPQHDYWLSINNDTFTNFRNPAGEVAEPYPISFTTRAAAAGAASRPAAKLSAEDNRSAIAALRQAIDEDYSYRDRLQIDWAKELEKRTAKMESAVTPNDFAREAASLLRLAQDAHVSLIAGDMVIGTKTNPSPPNFNVDTLRGGLVPKWEQHDGGVVTGRFDDGVAYVAIPSWGNKQAEAFDQLFAQLADSKALILDVRMNGGGGEDAALRVAGRFVEKPAVYSKDRLREGGEWKGPYDRVVEPRKDLPRYDKPVAVLIGPKVASTCESFVLMMKHGGKATLVGDVTKGSSGRPVAHDLGNGVIVRLSSWEDQLPDGTLLEGHGVRPDIAVRTNAADLARADPVLQAALVLLAGKP